MQVCAEPCCNISPKQSLQGWQDFLPQGFPQLQGWLKLLIKRQTQYRKVSAKLSGQNYLACSAESALQSFVGQWVVLLITAAGRAPRPAVIVDVIKMLLASEYLFLVTREKTHVGTRYKLP